MFGRTFGPPTFSAGFVSIKGVFADRSILGFLDAGIRPSQATAGVRSGTSTWFRLDEDGAVDTVGTFFAGDTYISPKHLTVIYPPLLQRAVSAAGDSLFYQASSARYEIRTYSQSGELVRVIRYNRAPKRLTDAAVDELVVAATAQADSAQRVMLEELYREVPYPESLPELGDMRVDRLGYLWVAEYRSPNEPLRRWHVFDPDGRLLGPIETPPGVDVREIGDDYILGTRRDPQLGVDRIVMFDLVKPSP
jgi:hypothetical protein